MDHETQQQIGGEVDFPHLFDRTRPPRVIVNWLCVVQRYVRMTICSTALGTQR